jgi:hypothetical protein
MYDDWEMAVCSLASFLAGFATGLPARLSRARRQLKALKRLGQGIAGGPGSEPENKGERHDA